MRRASRKFWNAGQVFRLQCQGFRTTCEAESTPLKPYVHFNSRQGRLGRTSLNWGVVLVGAGGLAYVNSIQEVPYTHRRHSIWLSAGMEKSIGVHAFEKMKEEEFANRRVLPPDHPVTRQVKAIGLEIVKSALEGKGGGYQNHMQNLDWEFLVVQKAEPNAMVLPGGKVVVHTGLLEMMSSVDELAAVLSHETAHVLARHVAEKVSRQQFWDLISLLAFWFIGLPVPPVFTQLALMLPNSRKIETEADTIGMQLAAQVCFNPSASVPVFEKLGDYERQFAGNIPSFLRTHPISEDRVKKVKENLPDALQAYEMSNCGQWQSHFRRSRF